VGDLLELGGYQAPQIGAWSNTYRRVSQRHLAGAFPAECGLVRNGAAVHRVALHAPALATVERLALYTPTDARVALAARAADAAAAGALVALFGTGAHGPHDGGGGPLEAGGRVYRVAVQGEPYVFLNTNTHGRNVWEAGDRPIVTRMAHIQGAAVEAPPASLASLAERGLVLLRFRVSPRVLERRLAAFLAPPGLDEPAAELLVPSAPPAAAPAAYAAAAAAAARAARPAAIGRLAVQLEGEAELRHFCNYDGGMNVSWAPELETARLPEPQALVVVSPEAYLTCNNGLQNDSSIFPYSAGGKASGGGFVDADENRRSLYPSYEHAQPRLEERSRNGRLDLAMVDARRAPWEPAPFSWDEDLQECVPCPGRTPACVYTMGQFCTFYLGMNYDQAARDCKVTGFQAFLEFFLAPSVLRSIRRGLL